MSHVETEWKAAFSHIDFPNVYLAFKFSAESVSSCPELPKNIDILQIILRDSDVEDDENSQAPSVPLVIERELKPLFRFCERYNDFEATFASCESYLKLSNERRKQLSSQAANVSVPSGCITVTYKSEIGREVAEMTWELIPLLDQTEFKEEYDVMFIQSGENMTYHFLFLGTLTYCTVDSH